MSHKLLLIMLCRFDSIKDSLWVNTEFVFMTDPRDLTRLTRATLCTMIVELVKKSIQSMDPPSTDQLFNNLKNQQQSRALLVYQIVTWTKHSPSFQKVSLTSHFTSFDPKWPLKLHILCFSNRHSIGSSWSNIPTRYRPTILDSQPWYRCWYG